MVAAAPDLLFGHWRHVVGPRFRNGGRTGKHQDGLGHTPNYHPEDGVANACLVVNFGVRCAIMMAKRKNTAF